MPVNAVSRPFRLLVNGLDFSPALLSFTGSNSRLDQSGLITFTGELVLGRTLVNLPASLDPRLSAFWTIGTAVVIEVATAASLAAGNKVFARHPRGALRILRVPSYDERERQLTIQVGDLLTLLNRDQPEGEKSGVSFGVSTAYSTILHNLLQAAGIPSGLTGTGPTDTINYPLIKCGGSYIEQAGKVAYAADWFLWCDNQEQIRALRVDLAPASPVLTSVHNRDLEDYERLDAAEVANPFDIVRAVGVRRTLNQIAYPLKQVYERYSTKQDLSRYRFGGDNDPVLMERTTTTIDWNPTTRTQTTTTKTERAEIVYIDYVFTTRISFAIVLTDEVEEVKIFNALGLLAYAKTSKKKPENYYSTSGSKTKMITYRVEEYFYYYGLKQILESTVHKQYQGRQELYGSFTTRLGFGNRDTQSISGGSFLELLPGVTTVDTWRELYRGYWAHEQEKFAPAATVIDRGNPDSLVSLSKEVWRGYNQGPPGPETQPGLYETTEVEIKAEVRFQSSTPYTRDEQFQVEYANTQQQLENLALIHGALKIGRAQGSYIACAFTDWFLTAYEPNARHDVTENGVTYAFMRDGEAFTLDQSNCLVGVDGLLLGTVD